MKTAWLYAGQGSQKAGMGRGLYETEPIFRAVIDRADDMLDFPLKRVMFEDPDGVIGQTRYTQPVLAAYAAGMTALLYDSGVRADYVAGLSLGEYSALHAAGVFSGDDLIRVAAYRGQAMDEAARGKQTKMAAIMGASEEQIKAVLSKVREVTGRMIVIANYNSAVQTVISGEEAAVDQAVTELKEAGVRRCVPLAVSGPFHTPMMKPAGEALSKLYQEKPTLFGPMRVPVVFNVTARPLAQPAPENIRDLLVKQVQSPVHMAQTIQWLADQGVEHVIEIGPGHTLTGFVHKTVKGITTECADSAADIARIREEAVWR